MNIALPSDGIPPRSTWTTQRAYIFASVAGVVGLGNIWRFPYMVGQNGGGTFVAAYLICILAVGIPLVILEAGSGSLTNRGPVGTFRRINATWGPWIGWFLVAMMLGIMSYYFVISGWTLGYAIDAVRGDIKPFDEFTSGFASVWLYLLVAVLVLIVILRGISRIERTSMFLLPVLVVTMVGLAVYSLTLPGAGQALDFYFSFNLKSFLEPKTWQMAAGQAFYSLSIGQGLIMTYGSYIPKNVSIVSSSVAVAVTNSAISITAGLMIFPIVFTFGIAPDTGSQLSFEALPAIFADLSGGRFIGIAFFLLLFLAAFTSCAGGMMVAFAPVRDEFHLSRTRAAVIVVAAVTLLAVPSALSFTSVGFMVDGRPFLDVIDTVAGSGVVVAAGITGAALLAWRLPRGQLLAAMNSSHSPRWALLIGRYLLLGAAGLLMIRWLIA
jgi:NSS family neurotransmitter:Na+ symporter